jgi:hypothetical protein
MSGRSRRHQPSSLLGLPQDLRIYITARVGATSERPLADLHSLRGTCSMLMVYIRIDLQVDFQVDKSSIVVKGPFFPQV